MLVFYGCEADYHGGQWCKSQSEIEGPSTRLRMCEGGRMSQLKQESKLTVSVLCAFFLP